MSIKGVLFTLAMLLLFSWTCESDEKNFSLAGRTYQLISLPWDTAGLRSFPAGPPSLEFSDSVLSGFTGCNRFFGTFSQEGNTIRLNLKGMTKMYCEGVNESGFIGASGAVNTLSVNGDTLRLFKDRQLVMVLLEKHEIKGK